MSSWSADVKTGEVSYTLSGGAAGDTVTLPVTISSANYEDTAVNVVITLTAKDDQAALVNIYHYPGSGLCRAGY